MTAIYIHIPFCRTRCAYCDFVTYTGKDGLMASYVSAVKSELRRHAAFVRDTVPSVYFGGGTPSRLSVSEVGGILTVIRENYTLADDAEITFEMNPCDVTGEKAQGLAAAGINRVSLGVQSAVPGELKSMNRRHTREQTIEAVEILRKAGIENITLDLIYGYPGQMPDSWQVSLEAALSLRPRHLSMYALNVEEGSILARQVAMGKVTLPSDDLTVALYEQGNTFLREHGFEHYEISNWAAAPEYESRHNRQYWLNREYLGIGAGAHGYFEHLRTENTGSIEDYIQKMKDSPDRYAAAVERAPQDETIEMQNTMMLGLRLLREGISVERFTERFGKDPHEVFRKELRRLKQKSLITEDEGIIRLCEKMVPVANQAFMEFVD